MPAKSSIKKWQRSNQNSNKLKLIKISFTRNGGILPTLFNSIDHLTGM